ncbi:MAG: zinc ribbon domain-containing protein, partial [Bacteroidota bacterium]
MRLKIRDLFNRVQKVKKRGVHKYKRHSYLFRGLITCEDCGGILSWETQKGNRYGRCNSYRNCIKRPYFKESELIALVSAEFDKFKLEDQRLLEYVRHAILDDHAQKVASQKSTLARFEQQLNRVNQRLRRIYLDRLDDRISIDQYDRLFKEFNEEKEEIISTQKDFLTNSDNYQEIGIVVYDLSQKAKEAFICADMEKQRKFMKLLFTKMTILDGKLNLELDLAFQILATAVRKSKSSKMALFEKAESEIFEPLKNPYSTTKNSAFRDFHPTLLAAWAKFRTYDWLASSKLLMQSNYMEASILLDYIKKG